jgi:hypothetical protein
MTNITRFAVGAALFAVLASVGLAARASAPAGRYTINMGTVTDTQTGLIWQQTAPSGTYTWGSSTTAGTAQNYCEALALNGIKWRVPTMKEIQTIVDDSVVTGTPMDLTYFPGAPAAIFWTATAVSGMTSRAWVGRFNSFNKGGEYVNTADESTLYDVRCVH